jgi:hypothetical protein
VARRGKSLRKNWCREGGTPVVRTHQPGAARTRWPSGWWAGRLRREGVSRSAGGRLTSPGQEPRHFRQATPPPSCHFDPTMTAAPAPAEAPAPRRESCSYGHARKPVEMQLAALQITADCGVRRDPGVTNSSGSLRVMGPTPRAHAPAGMKRRPSHPLPRPPFGAALSVTASRV